MIILTSLWHMLPLTLFALPLIHCVMCAIEEDDGIFNEEDDI